jgi:thiamine-phosphate pyrophosphorylase
MSTFFKCSGLYLVTPNWDDTERLLASTEQALLGGVRLLQYRHKTATAHLKEQQARGLLTLCRQFQVPMIINDDLDLCKKIHADGIHLGATDIDVAHARQQLGEEKIIGASCYGDLSLAVAAQQAGASYVAFGGFYPSLVKQYPVTTAPEILTKAQGVITCPIVVIGGMTPLLARPLVAFGAHMVAAISSVYGATNPREAAQEFTRLFT